MAAETAVQGKKVLIIEDDPLLHTLLTDKLAQLRAEGLDMYPTMNAEEGLEKAKEVKPDVILLDLVLPGMTGFEFLEKLRAIPELAHTRVAILSNLSDDSDKEKAKSLGVVAYLVKANFSLSEISDAIRQILQGRDVTAAIRENPAIQKTPSGNLIFL